MSYHIKDYVINKNKDQHWEAISILITTKLLVIKYVASFKMKCIEKS